MKKSVVLAMALLLTGTFVGMSCAASCAIADPVAAYWCLDGVEGCTGRTISEWSSDTLTPKFYQNKTPIQPTIAVSGDRADSVAGVVPLISFKTSTTIAQFDAGVSNVNQFTFWQYVPRLTYFGGSASEGQILAPQPGWIAAAHKNGKPILGSVFFSPGVYGGDKEEAALKKMLTPEDDGSYTVAKSLVDIAKTYGFDGYFINQETDSSVNGQFAGFIHYFHEYAKQQNMDLQLTWYQVPATTLTTSLLTNSTTGEEIADHVFLDYSWMGAYGGVQGLDEQAAQVGYPLNDLDFGINVSSYPTFPSQAYFFTKVMPLGQAPNGSISLFAEQAITKGVTTLEQRESKESAYWNSVGVNTAATSAVTSLPFVTTFNTGQGRYLFLDGQKTAVTDWNDMGSQDYLPAWRKSVDNKTVTFNYDDAYEGGDSLELSGVLISGEAAIIPLYATKLTLHGDELFQAMLKVTGDVAANLCLQVQGQERLCYPLDTSVQNQWTKSSFDLINLSEKVLSKISLEVEGDGKVSVKLGKLYLGEDLPMPQLPMSLSIIQQGVDGQGHAVAYLSWKASDVVYLYDVWGELKGKWQLLGRTHQSIFAVISASATQQYQALAVSAVNAQGAASEKVVILMG